MRNPHRFLRCNVLPAGTRRPANRRDRVVRQDPASKPFTRTDECVTLSFVRNIVHG
jgi:hypothetical protein